RRRHTRSDRDWSSDVCSSDLVGRLAGAGSFADFGFAASIAFAAIVRGLDRRMLDEHKQAVWVVHQLVLQADEVGLVRWGLVRNEIGRASCRDRVVNMIGVL